MKKERILKIDLSENKGDRNFISGFIMGIVLVTTDGKAFKVYSISEDRKNFTCFIRCLATDDEWTTIKKHVFKDFMCRKITEILME